MQASHLESVAAIANGEAVTCAPKPKRVENRQLPDGTAGSRKSPVFLGLVKIRAGTADQVVIRSGDQPLLPKPADVEVKDCSPEMWCMPDGRWHKAAGLPSGAAPLWLMWWQVSNRTGAWRQPTAWLTMQSRSNPSPDSDFLLTGKNTGGILPKQLLRVGFPRPVNE